MWGRGRTQSWAGDCSPYNLPAGQFLLVNYSASLLFSHLFFYLFTHLFRTWILKYFLLILQRFRIIESSLHTGSVKLEYTNIQFTSNVFSFLHYFDPEMGLLSTPFFILLCKKKHHYAFLDICFLYEKKGLWVDLFSRFHFFHSNILIQSWIHNFIRFGFCFFTAKPFPTIFISSLTGPTMLVNCCDWEKGWKKWAEMVKKHEMKFRHQGNFVTLALALNKHWILQMIWQNKLE